MTEIHIGTDNNTVTRILRGGQQVAAVQTPNILRDGLWTGFTITWANEVILLNREGERFPFISFTLDQFFPINFYGLRSP